MRPNKDQLDEWKKRNKLVLSMHDIAKGIVEDLVNNEHVKADVILLGELILDIGKRLD